MLSVGHVPPSSGNKRTSPSVAVCATVWDSSYMEITQETPLQDFVRRAIDQSGRARDHFDKQIQKLTGTTGKPLYDLSRGKGRNPGAAMLDNFAIVLRQPSELLHKAARGEQVDPVPWGPSTVDKLTTFIRDQAALARVAGPPNPIVPVAGDGEVVQIQKLDLSLSMGPGTLIDDYVESELVSFDLNFVRLFTRAPSDRLRLVTGIGDSMEPTLRWGDLILIDANDRMLSKQDGIYWINLFGAAGIKRLRAVGPRKILVKSDNPLHDDQEVDADDLRIEGRAIWATRGL